MTLSFNEYQKRADKTAVYPPEKGFEYLATGIAAEAGEVAGLISKGIRGDNLGMVAEDDLVKEIGDVLWFVAQLASHMDIDLEEVAEKNLAKLEDRQKRGVIKGSGDDR